MLACRLGRGCRLSGPKFGRPLPRLAFSAPQWICMVILACMALFYRVLFFAALKWKEWKSM